ncbi:hypothetical protein AaE_003837, partial [Aphanomyces astaci]
MFNYKLVSNAIESKVSQQAIDAPHSNTQSAKEKTTTISPVVHPTATIDEQPLRIQTTLYSGATDDDDTPTSQSSSTTNRCCFGSAVTGIDGDEFLRVIPFAVAWNHCLRSMREADVLSNRELSVLSYLIEGDDDATSRRRLYPPAFLTAGKLDESLDIVAECGHV